MYLEKINPQLKNNTQQVIEYPYFKLMDRNYLELYSLLEVLCKLKNQLFFMWMVIKSCQNIYMRLAHPNKIYQSPR
ncbi:unnamed protein product [Paramecium octaurelia]|uniref:Uncharacterized protein n=1 Tax=Paramecium octaurelia TaxID=43137 RepID=A0A8S1WX37_PAROT|nr:unnamed protein product [Paramecium octaurelia]